MMNPGNGTFSALDEALRVADLSKQLVNWGSEQEKHMSVCLVALAAEYRKLQTEIEMLQIELSGCNGALDMEREHLKITEAELSKAQENR